MPYKDKDAKTAYAKLYHKTWYEKNKHHRRAQIYAKRKRERDEWQEFKASIKCERCGAQHAAIIDFHHPNPSKDDTKVFKLVAAKQFKRAYEEAARCHALCANCHRIEHWQDQQVFPEDQDNQE
jgi:hypothetical protein